MRQFIKIAACVAALASLFACNKLNEPQVVNAPEDAPVTKAAVDNAPILAVYVETNDVNPLNAGDYTVNDGEPFIDIVELFAANIHKETVDNQVRPTLYLNDKLANILENGGVEKYVWPLQDMGIKVFLTNLGDHQGIGLANMNATQAEQFATILAATVYHYGLDGIGFDDEYADYNSINSTSYSNILLNLRSQLDDLESILGKDLWMTVFDWGYTNTISSAAAACVDYAYHGYFGSYYTYKKFSLPNSKWSPLSFNLGSGVAQSTAQNYASRAKNEGYGAMMCFNLRTRTNVTASTGETISGNDPLPVFQGISNGAYGGLEVACSNGNRSRDVEIDSDGFTITYDMALEWLAE